MNAMTDHIPRRFGPLVEVAANVFVHETALVFGKVTIAEDCSVWPYATIRSEVHEVRIGRGSNVQDHVMIHVGYDHPTVIGTMCSITHHATIHGARLGDNVLVGINATVMDGAEIGDNTIIAGHTIVREGMQVPANSIVAGVPGRIVGSRDNRAANVANAEFYSRNGQNYARGVHRFQRVEQD